MSVSVCRPVFLFVLYLETLCASFGFFIRGVSVSLLLFYDREESRFSVFHRCEGTTNHRASP